MSEKQQARFGRRESERVIVFALHGNAFCLFEGGFSFVGVVLGCVGMRGFFRKPGMPRPRIDLTVGRNPPGSGKGPVRHCVWPCGRVRARIEPSKKERDREVNIQR